MTGQGLYGKIAGRAFIQIKGLFFQRIGKFFQPELAIFSEQRRFLISRFFFNKIQIGNDRLVFKADLVNQTGVKADQLFKKRSKHSLSRVWTNI